MAAALWPQGIQGVLTHDTALDLWDVSDVNPAKIHITVRADTARSERSPGHT
jgi:predicted transcriptional regulator of viral defense system